MKEVFMAHLTLPEYFSKEMWDIIPAQRRVVNDLLEQRIILNYALDMDRRNLWVYINAEDIVEANSVLKQFPILKFVKIRIHELAFYDIAPVGLPELLEDSQS